MKPDETFEHEYTGWTRTELQEQLRNVFYLSKKSGAITGILLPRKFAL